MQIEPATSADIPALCELLHDLFTQETEFAPDAEAQQRGLRMIIDNPDAGVILVAHQGGRVVAMVNLLYTISSALGERVALLEDMVVAPAQRGVGIGSKLLATAVSFARQQDCRRITLLTDADNEAAQRFYRRHGFVLSPMVPMRLTLTDC